MHHPCLKQLAVCPPLSFPIHTNLRMHIFAKSEQECRNAEVNLQISQIHPACIRIILDFFYVSSLRGKTRKIACNTYNVKYNILNKPLYLLCMGLPFRPPTHFDTSGTPWKINVSNLKNEGGGKMFFIFNRVMFRFHLNFQDYNIFSFR